MFSSFDTAIKSDLDPGPFKEYQRKVVVHECVDLTEEDDELTICRMNEAPDVKPVIKLETELILSESEDDKDFKTDLTMEREELKPKCSKTKESSDKKTFIKREAELIILSESEEDEDFKTDLNVEEDKSKPKPIKMEEPPGVKPVVKLESEIFLSDDEDFETGYQESSSHVLSTTDLDKNQATPFERIDLKPAICDSPVIMTPLMDWEPQIMEEMTEEENHPTDPLADNDEQTSTNMDPLFSLNDIKNSHVDVGIKLEDEITRPSTNMDPLSLLDDIKNSHVDVGIKEEDEITRPSTNMDPLSSLDDIKNSHVDVGIKEEDEITRPSTNMDPLSSLDEMKNSRVAVGIKLEDEITRPRLPLEGRSKDLSLEGMDKYVFINDTPKQNDQSPFDLLREWNRDSEQSAEDQNNSDVSQQNVSSSSSTFRPSALSAKRKPFTGKWVTTPYTQKHDGKRQLRLINTSSEKRYPCDKCGKQLKKTELRFHELKHYGLKPYTCSRCGKKFTQKSAFMKHVIAHSQKIERKMERTRENHARDRDILKAWSRLSA